MDTKIATPTGWVRNGDIQKGDDVLTPYGTVTTVTGVYPQGTRPVYEVTLRDGSASEVCNEHLWQIERSKTAIKYIGERKSNGGRAYVGTGPNGQTHEMISEIINTDELKARVDNNRQINLPQIEPLAYYEQDLPVDPYLLGVILGDGIISPKGSVHFKNGDDFIASKLEQRGLNISHHQTPHYYGVLDIAPKMREIGLNGKCAHDKFIPEMYLYGSVSQRLDLLRGLMDTDGTISNTNEMEYSTASQTLAEDVQNLIRSLGGRVSINEKDNIYYTSPMQQQPKRASKAYRLQNIRLHRINPFSLPRKADKWMERDDNSGNRVVSVTYMRDEPVQCISVADERHLYIVDDYMPTHNTENIVFLKSTDDNMIDTLVKMSGTTHETRTDQKTVTRDNDRVLNKNEGKISYTMATKEKAVIEFNDFMFIQKSNSIVIKAGSKPIWNHNETVYPMSFRLLRDTIKLPGKQFSLQTIPTNSTAKDFDVRKNQPNFFNMLWHRVQQARMVDDMYAAYKKTYNLKESDLIQIDPNVLAEDIMHGINRKMFDIEHQKAHDSEDENAYGSPDRDIAAEAEDYQEVLDEARKQEQAEQHHAIKRYANNMLSRADFVHYSTGQLVGQLDDVLAKAYEESKNHFDNAGDFRVTPEGDLTSADGEIFVRSSRGVNRQDADTMEQAEEDPDTNVYSEDNPLETYYEITEAFVQYLVSLDSWQDIAGGRFDREVARAYDIKVHS